MTHQQADCPPSMKACFAQGDPGFDGTRLSSSLDRQEQCKVPVYA
jgi:hypothetical protein